MELVRLLFWIPCFTGVSLRVSAFSGYPDYDMEYYPFLKDQHPSLVPIPIPPRENSSPMLMHPNINELVTQKLLQSAYYEPRENFRSYNLYETYFPFDGRPDAPSIAPFQLVPSMTEQTLNDLKKTSGKNIPAFPTGFNPENEEVEDAGTSEEFAPRRTLGVIRNFLSPPDLEDTSSPYMMQKDLATELEIEKNRLENNLRYRQLTNQYLYGEDHERDIELQMKLAREQEERKFRQLENNLRLQRLQKMFFNDAMTRTTKTFKYNSPKLKTRTRFSVIFPFFG